MNAWESQEVKKNLGMVYQHVKEQESFHCYKTAGK